MIHPSPPIDWNAIAQATPFLLKAYCWLVWLAFLLLPAALGLHGAALQSTASNMLYVLVGLTFCITISILLQAGAGIRATLFALILFILAYWF